MRLKSGMNVRVISGNHKGKEGKILKVIKIIHLKNTDVRVFLQKSQSSYIGLIVLEITLTLLILDQI